VHRVRYKSPDLCAQVILDSPIQIGGLFRHDDGREMVLLRIPKLDSLGSRNQEVSLLVILLRVSESLSFTLFVLAVAELALALVDSPKRTSHFSGQI